MDEQSFTKDLNLGCFFFGRFHPHEQSVILPRRMPDRSRRASELIMTATMMRGRPTWFTSTLSRKCYSVKCYEAASTSLQHVIAKSTSLSVDFSESSSTTPSSTKTIGASRPSEEATFSNTIDRRHRKRLAGANAGGLGDVYCDFNVCHRVSICAFVEWASGGMG